mgnify:CR=1 FL=1
MQSQLRNRINFFIGFFSKIISSFKSLSFKTIGFSQITLQPFKSEVLIFSKCQLFGVQIETKSTPLESFAFFKKSSNDLK